MRRIVSIAIVALAGLVPAGASDLSPRQLHDARDLYDVKCAKCHKFYDPAEYSQQEWDVWMRKMSRKAKLKSAQSELLGKYLQTFRDKNTTAAPAP